MIITHLNQKQIILLFRRWTVLITVAVILFMVIVFLLRMAYVIFRDVEKIEESISIPIKKLTKSSVDIDIDKKGIGIWFSLRVKRNDNYLSMLRAHYVPESDIAVLRKNKLVRKHLGKLRIGEYIKVLQDTDKSLLTLTYEINNDTLLSVSRVDGELFATITKVPIDTHEQFASIKIRDSLFAEGYRLGLANSIMVQIFQIFSWDIDFSYEIQKGDEFNIIYEKLYKNGQYFDTGKIQIAEYIPAYRNRKKLQAFLFADDTGQIDYYDLKGNSLKKSFLRQPINPASSRISSGFTRARYHPIKKIWRAHKGIDFAAKTGTPIYATGKGTIKKIGYTKDYGNRVMIKHANQYETLYGHMSRFRKGLRKGQFVQQKQIIGYVGQTGLASGPHVHYEMRIRGRHVNPRSIVLKRGKNISAKYKTKFLTLANEKYNLLQSNKNNLRLHGAVQGDKNFKQ